MSGARYKNAPFGSYGHYRYHYRARRHAFRAWIAPWFKRAGQRLYEWVRP